MKKVWITIIIVLVVIAGFYFIYNLITNKVVFKFELTSGEVVDVLANKSLYVINTDKINITGKNNECISFFEITTYGGHFIIMPYDHDENPKRIVTIYYKDKKMERVFNFIINAKEKIDVPDTCKE